MKRHWETDEPAMVKETGINALVLDTVQFYAELRPIQLGMPYISTSLVTLLFAFMVGLIKLPMAEPSLSDAIHGQSKFHRDIYRVLRVPERILSPIMRWTQNSHMRPPTRMKSRSIPKNAGVGLGTLTRRCTFYVP